MCNDITANTVLSTTSKNGAWIILHALWITYGHIYDSLDDCRYIQIVGCKLQVCNLLLSPSMDKTTKLYKTAWDLKIFYKSNAFTLISRKQEMQQTDKIARLFCLNPKYNIFQTDIQSSRQTKQQRKVLW